MAHTLVMVNRFKGDAQNGRGLLHFVTPLDTPSRKTGPVRRWQGQRASLNPPQGDNENRVVGGGVVNPTSGSVQLQHAASQNVRVKVDNLLRARWAIGHLTAIRVRAVHAANSYRRNVSILLTATWQGVTVLFTC